MFISSAMALSGRYVLRLTMHGATSVNLSVPSLLSIIFESIYSLKLAFSSLTVTLFSSLFQRTSLPKASPMKRSGTKVLLFLTIGLALFVTLFPSMIKLSDAALVPVFIRPRSSIDSINKFLISFFISSPLF